MEDLKKYMWWIIGGIAALILVLVMAFKKPSKKTRRRRAKKYIRTVYSNARGYGGRIMRSMGSRIRRTR